MLTPPPGVRERILSVGGFGSGKTTSWLNIAKWSHDTGSDARFYVLDTDSSVGHMLSVPDSQYADLDNVTLFEVYDWTEYTEALNASTAAVRPNLDWIVVDFASSAWDAVQEYYVAQVYKTNIDEFFFEQTKARKSGNPLDGWKDWSIINRLYKQWANTLIHRHQGHVFMVAGAKVLSDSADRSVRALFGAHGIQPTGQKHLGHLPHTVILNRVGGPGEVFMTTVKDRERPVMDNVALHQFAVDYLVTVAGWSL